MSPRYTVIDARGRQGTPPPPLPGGIDRREALAWMASGAALAMASCSQPVDEIVPAVEAAPGETVGVARRYATTVPLGGYGRGVTGIVHEGRPTKLEGSPNHPASLGSTDVFAEAEVLSLYDPGRPSAVEGPAGPADWGAFADALAPRLAMARGKGGAGLTLVTGRVTSPTELRLIGELQAAMPAMAWRRFEPVNADAAGGVAPPPLEGARTILCLDADPLGPGAGQIAASRAFAAMRDPGRGAMTRLYAVEPGWSLTGMNADHRLALRPELIAAVARRVAVRLGAGGASADAPTQATPPELDRFADAVAADLSRAGPAGRVLAGRSQPPQVHALAAAINARLGAPAGPRGVDPHPQGCFASLAALAADLRGGRVETLVAIGANPAYDAPGELGFEGLLRRAPFTAAADLQPSETLVACRWRLPLSHPLESWGDLRAPSGEASLMQPLVRPLHDTRTAAEVLAMLAGQAAPVARDLVRATWSNGAQDAAFEASWREALTRGVLAQAPPAAPAAPPLVSSPGAGEPSAAPPPPTPTGAPQGWVLTLAPDPTLHDGRFAGNAWLQECPKPLTHEVWGAALAISPHDAAHLGLKDGDHVELSARGAKVVAPVRIAPGQAQGAVSGFLGGGRRAAGPIGTGVGVDYGPLRSLASPWTVAVALRPVHANGAPPAFASTPRLEGDARKLSPVVTADGRVSGAAALHAPLRPPSNYPDRTPHEPAWAMVIDAAACTGCNACVVACQAENNVPVVGPHETARGRDMHWLRIDSYDVGAPSEPRIAFQPVPCMQCEHAPCEPVCPVEASVHDHEGLNAQVYNRCIGTRFCESNCPYKVRRFNFYGYAHDQAYENLGDASYAGQRNPEVTVRARGVMEKCTYCVQRISAARRLAEREMRDIGPDEVVTACQAACPTRAIRFGDLTREGSQIAALRCDPRHYALLAELGTRPRTTYLARTRNPNPALEPKA